jgi:hypothetical protein
MAHATGSFDVKVTPLPADPLENTGGFARLSLDKQFHGALEGTSRGQMVAAESAVKGSCRTRGPTDWSVSPAACESSSTEASTRTSSITR